MEGGMHGRSIEARRIWSRLLIHAVKAELKFFSFFKLYEADADWHGAPLT